MSNRIPEHISFWKYMQKAKGKALLMLFILIGVASGVIWLRLEGKWDVLGTTIAVGVLWLWVPSGVFFALAYRRKGKPL